MELSFIVVVLIKQSMNGEVPFGQSTRTCMVPMEQFLKVPYNSALFYLQGLRKPRRSLSYEEETRVQIVSSIRDQIMIGTG